MAKVYSKEWMEKVMAMTTEERITLADKDIHAPEGIVAVASACAELISLDDKNVTMRVLGSLLGMVTALGASPFQTFTYLLHDPVLRKHLGESAVLNTPVPGEKGN
jgi:hypothetical protein